MSRNAKLIMGRKNHIFFPTTGWWNNHLHILLKIAKPRKKCVCKENTAQSSCLGAVQTPRYHKIQKGWPSVTSDHGNFWPSPRIVILPNVKLILVVTRNPLIYRHLRITCSIVYPPSQSIRFKNFWKIEWTISLNPGSRKIFFVWRNTPKQLRHQTLFYEVIW